MCIGEKLEAWAKKEWMRLGTLRRAGEALCDDFRGARDEATRYRVILSFAARQDNPFGTRPDTDEMPCVAEVEAPPFFRVCCEELTKEGLLRFEKREACYDLEKNKYGIAYFLLGLTYKGRMELVRLEREQKELKARKWRWIAPALTFAAGVIFSTIVSILLPRLTNTLLDRWLSPEVHQVEAVNLPADGVDAPGK